MIHARLLRTLELPVSPGTPEVAHMSAASGLVRVGQRLFVVADDELCLGMFDLHGQVPAELLRLFEGELPLHHGERKAEKPDLEAITTLPAFAGYPFGALLAVGSGSKPNRQRAVLLRLDDHGSIDGSLIHVDMRPLYEPLRASMADLNIEGLFISEGKLCLLQRGNSHSQVNACVKFDWHEVERWMRGASVAPKPRSICVLDLGSIDGVPLSFTDGAALHDGGWVFSAAAEDTADSYADGRCAGSAVGIVNSVGTLVRVERVAGAHKIEGIAVADDGEPLELLLVTDADDRGVAAQLLSVSLPRSK